MVEKAIYELRYELNNRPAWMRIPLRGLLSLLGEPRQWMPEGA
jgi:maltose alpha-D-glucosyltransferase/alpha-amylase